MKLSDNTLAILKSFSAINGSICFKAGSQIRTKSAGRDIMAIVDVAETFPVDFSVYELGRFLNVLSLFSDPELTFNESYVSIGSGKNSVKYAYTSNDVLGQAVITQAEYSKQPRLQETIGAFELKQADLTKIMKAASVLGVPNITIRGADGIITMTAHDKKNDSSDEFSLDLGTTENNFEATFKIESLKMLPLDYEVEVTATTITKFTNAQASLSYYVAGEISR